MISVRDKLTILWRLRARRISYTSIFPYAMRIPPISTRRESGQGIKNRNLIGPVVGLLSLHCEPGGEFNIDLFQILQAAALPRPEGVT